MKWLGFVTRSWVQRSRSQKTFSENAPLRWSHTCRWFTKDHLADRILCSLVNHESLKTSTLVTGDMYHIYVNFGHSSSVLFTCEQIQRTLKRERQTKQLGAAHSSLFGWQHDKLLQTNNDRSVTSDKILSHFKLFLTRPTIWNPVCGWCYIVILVKSYRREV